MRRYESTRLVRTKPQDMDELLHQWLKDMRLSSSLNEQRIFAAWDKVSGAGRYTVRKFVRGGVLYCNLSSSVVRSQLNLQRESLRDAINAELETDKLFSKGDNRTGYLKAVVLK